MFAHLFYFYDLSYKFSHKLNPWNMWCLQWFVNYTYFDLNIYVKSVNISFSTNWLCGIIFALLMSWNISAYFVATVPQLLYIVILNCNLEIGYYYALKFEQRIVNNITLLLNLVSSSWHECYFCSCSTVVFPSIHFLSFRILDILALSSMFCYASMLPSFIFLSISTVSPSHCTDLWFSPSGF